MDSISDFCTCIRNAILAGHDKVDVPHSNLCRGIVEQFKKHGYIRGYNVVDDDRQGMMRVYLKYNEKQISAISFIKRMSRPSCRQYVKVDEIPEIRSGYGLTVLSTNKGILSDKEARKNKVGGEVLCQVW